MGTLTITIRADSAAAMNTLLAEHGILQLVGGALQREIGLLHWTAGEAPAVASGWFWMGHWDDNAQGQARRAALEEALGDHYWTGTSVASVLGVAGYAVPTGNDLIKHERDRRIQAGGYKVGDHWFHSDPTSRDQQAMLYIKAKEILAAGGSGTTPMPNPANPAAPLLWKTLSGPYVPMTPNLAIAIVDAAQAKQAALHLVAAQAMMAGTAPGSIQWPETFQV